MSDGALVNFDIPDDIDLTKIVSTKIILENVYCSGSVMIRYTSSKAYKKLAFYGVNEGDFAYNCGTGIPKMIEAIQLDSNIINGQTSAVIIPYSTTYPVQIDKIYLKITYLP